MWHMIITTLSYSLACTMIQGAYQCTQSGRVYFHVIKALWGWMALIWLACATPLGSAPWPPVGIIGSSPVLAYTSVLLGLSAYVFWVKASVCEEAVRGLWQVERDQERSWEIWRKLKGWSHVGYLWSKGTGVTAIHLFSMLWVYIVVEGLVLGKRPTFIGAIALCLSMIALFICINE